jgi:DNA-binding CsgD family transcriptional regulator/PAS domain-containing protein
MRSPARSNGTDFCRCNESLCLSNVLHKLDPSDLERLSSREEQVLALASAGLLDKQIAAELGITLNTLRTYWSRIRAKIGDVPRSALSALFAERKAVQTERGILGASWDIDLQRQAFCYYGDRDFPNGEMKVEDLLQRFHPDDAPRVRSLLASIVEQDVPPFMFVARYVTDHGLELASAYVVIERDESGRAVRMVGRAAPLINLSSPNISASVGSYVRDLATNRIDADDGFCKIFRVNPGDPDLLERVINRNCPEYRETFRAIVAEMIAHGRQTLTHTYRLCFEDGTQLWTSSHVSLEFESGRPVRVRATVIAYE